MNEILATSSSTSISYSGGGTEIAFIFLGILGIILLALIIAALISIISISKSMKKLIDLEYKKYKYEQDPKQATIDMMTPNNSAQS